MGQGAFCDRCARARRDLVKISWPNGSHDLCTRCLSTFLHWMRLGAEQHARQVAKPTPIREADWLRMTREVCERDGDVSPDTLSAHGGMTRAKAQWQLNFMVRVGHLERGKRLGRYVLQRVEQGEQRAG